MPLTNEEKEIKERILKEETIKKTLQRKRRLEEQDRKAREPLKGKVINAKNKEALKKLGFKINQAQA